MAADEMIKVEAHEFKIAYLAIGLFHAGPELLTVESVEAAAPLGPVITRQGGGEALADDGTPPAHARGGFRLVGTGGGVGPFQDSPFGRDAEATDDE